MKDSNDNWFPSIDKYDNSASDFPEKNVQDFLNFCKYVMGVEENRRSAKEVLQHPWLQSAKERLKKELLKQFWKFGLGNNSDGTLQKLPAAPGKEPILQALQIMENATPFERYLRLGFTAQLSDTYRQTHGTRTFLLFDANFDGWISNEEFNVFLSVIYEHEKLMDEDKNQDSMDKKFEKFENVVGKLLEFDAKDRTTSTPSSMKSVFRVIKPGEKKTSRGIDAKENPDLLNKGESPLFKAVDVDGNGWIQYSEYCFLFLYTKELLKYDKFFAPVARGFFNAPFGDERLSNYYEPEERVIQPEVLKNVFELADEGGENFRKIVAEVHHGEDYEKEVVKLLDQRH